MWIWDVKRSAAKSRLRVNWENAVGKSVENLFFEPPAKQFSLGPIPPLDEQHSDFELKDGNGAEKQAGGRNIFRPADDGFRCAVGLCAAQLGDDVCIGEVYQSRRGGRKRDPLSLGGLKRTLSARGMVIWSTMLSVSLVNF